MIQALLVDDERLARLEMRSVLNDFSDRIKVIGEAASKADVIAYLSSPQNPSPDVIFLDINMPNGSGFDVLDEIGYDGESPIHIVFVTAYDEYAVRAFTVNALDYLLKPIDPDRLEQTIKRLEKVVFAAKTDTTINITIDTKTDTDEEQNQNIVVETAPLHTTEEPHLKQFEQELAVKLTKEDIIFVTIGRNRRFVPLTEIVCITSSDNYSEIRLADGKRTMILRTMNEWEEMLPEQDFMRIHRGTIINLAYLDQTRPVEASGSGALLFLLNIDEPFAVSRRMYAKWKEVR